MALLLFFPYLPYPHHHSGASALIYRLIVEFGQYHQIDLMVFDHPGIEDRDIAHIKGLVRKLHILPYPIPGQRQCLIRHRLNMPPVGREMSRSIQNLIQNGDYELVICASYLTSIITHRLLPDRIVSLPIDAFSRLHHQLSKNTAEWLKRIKHLISVRLFSYYERTVMHRFKKTIVVSPRDCRYLNRINRKLNCEAIPLGIEPERFREFSSPRDPMSMLFTGNFQYTPNRQAAFFLVKKVMPLLAAEIPNIRLFLVGKDPGADLLSFRSSRIIVPGFVDDIDHYYRTCQLFISPLICGTGIKNKILEAAAAGMPILASRVSLEGIRIDPDIFQIARDPEEFSGKARELLNDPRRCEELGLLGREQVMLRYNLHTQSRRYLTSIIPNDFAQKASA